MKYLSILFVLGLTGCATIHNGNYASTDGQDDGKPSGSGVVISGEENSDLSSKNFGAIDFTFENTSSEWVRVKSVNIDFGDKTLNEAVKVPVGPDLVAWARAAQQNKAIHDYNVSMILGTAAIASTAVVAGSTRGSGGKVVGTAGLLGAMGGLSVMAINQDLDRVQLAKMVPDEHLMSNDFVIPPGLHTKKWIALYTKDPAKIPRVKLVTISYALENGKVEKATLAFRGMSGSKWQP